MLLQEQLVELLLLSKTAEAKRFKCSSRLHLPFLSPKLKSEPILKYRVQSQLQNFDPKSPDLSRRMNGSSSEKRWMVSYTEGKEKHS